MTMPHRHLPRALLLLAVALTGVGAQAATFRPVNGLSSNVEDARLATIPGHVSAVVKGDDWQDDLLVYDWDPLTGPAVVGTIPAASQQHTLVNGVSADGQTVVGQTCCGSVAYRWTPVGGRQTLGTLPGNNSPESVAYAVSRDGSVIVGLASRTNGGGGYEATRWTEAGGLEGLGHLPGFTYSSAAEGVSDNGLYVVGSSGSGPSSGQAYRWDAGNGLLALGFLPGLTQASKALAVSDDGSVVTGYSRASNGASEAFRWTAGTGMVSLSLPDSYEIRGTHVSGDGSTILGWTSSDGAFIWTEAGGMQRLLDVLVAHGAPNLAGWTLNDILDVSHDGSRILGRGNQGLFIADLNAVPLPAGAWLFGSALAGLAWLRRAPKPGPGA